MEVARRSDWKTDFDNVDSKVDQSLRDLQFFSQIHTGPGRLFSIAQGRVVDGDFSVHEGRD